jgi:hypothetical protein
MAFSDPSFSNNIIEGIKPCAGKGCRKTGTNSLEVMYINKIGWFCDSCKNALLKDNIVAQGEEKITPQQKSEKWRQTFETPEKIFLKEISTGSRTGKITEPAAEETADNDTRALE